MKLQLSILRNMIMEENTIYTPFPTQLIDALKVAEDIAVFGHSSPDGDCIFSQLACREIFSAMGKNVTLFNQGPFTRNEIRQFESEFLSEVPSSLVQKTPLVVVVDCSTADRPGYIITPLLDDKIIVLDHHSSGESFTDENLMKIIPASVSTSLIVDALRQELGLPLTPTLASYIYKGFATDTGFYHFINEKVGGETLRRVSHLVDQGISPYIVYDEMHDGRNLSYFKMVASLIDRVHSAYEGRLLYTYQKASDEVEGKPADDIYAQLLQVKGVKVVLFFKEKDGCVEIGMRSKNLSGIDIGSFAASLGGGGHKYAAGAKSAGKLDEVMKTTITKLEGIISAKD